MFAALTDVTEKNGIPSQYAHITSGAQDAANQHDKHELAMYLTWTPLLRSKTVP
ncbi:Uncharacterised protein [Yersinia frederiksenii]|uniref:Uncharacterized protein n=2 Tax=Yersinia frederiksenii TaxID=29484 RepID=A0A380PXI1_YERFR|nr:hypothetical protein DJ58_1132 [Yersinia frederiksenii ATCC 33641]SUP78231.1 Uncharacterised protein [Yersinia frederiksenii]